MSALDPYIPFGTHAGKHASDIEPAYLEWATGKDGWAKGELRQQLLEHLNSRTDRCTTVQPIKELSNDNPGTPEHPSPSTRRRKQAHGTASQKDLYAQ